MTLPISGTCIVVFDVNVYLDVARHLGEPFDWSLFNDESIAVSRLSQASYRRRHWSLAALALTMSGRLVGSNALEVWTSDHIDGLVRHKAKQPDDPRLDAEDRGLGWSDDNASALVDNLIWEFVERSGGGSMQVVVPHRSPPLSHEDGMVYATARRAADGDESMERIVVTGDNDFLNDGTLQYPTVMHPSTFVRAVREARARAGIARIPKPKIE